MDQPADWEHTTPSDVLSTGILDTVIETSTDVIFHLDRDGNIRDTVDTEDPTLGYCKQALVGNQIQDILPASDGGQFRGHSDAVDEFLSAITANRATEVSVPFETANGSVKSLAVTIRPREGEESIICLGEEQDTTESSSGHLWETQRLQDTIADPLFALDEESRLTRINDAMLAYTGYDRDTLLGRAFLDLVPTNETETVRTQFIDLVTKDRKPQGTIELPISTSEGNLQVAEAHVTVLHDDDGTYTGAIGVLRDIRKRKRRERDLKRLVEVYKRVFRHNVRNELGVVTGRAELLKEAVDESLANHTEQILESTERLLEHSDKARRLEAVIESEAVVELDLQPQVARIVENARETHPKVRLKVDLPETMPVHAHPDIDTAIEELVENAIRHAPAQTTPRLYIWVDQETAGETLFIEDESGGLADHEIQVLRKGSEDNLEHSDGVGLWLVRWLVEYSDAELIVHRTAKGTLMGIRFTPQEQDSKEIATAFGATPVANPPQHVQEISPVQFQGDPVIGRVDVLSEFEDRYDALERKGSQAILVTGEAGIGKTTLLNQFRERLQDENQPPAIATGHCEQQTQPPYQAFREILAALPADQEPATLFENTPSRIATDAEELQQRKRELFASVANQLRAVATTQPVVVIVEDLQWADPGTINLFDYLLEDVGQWGYPILFVGTYSTSSIDRTHRIQKIADRTAETGRGTIIELEPFDQEMVESLLGAILNVDHVPATFTEAVCEHTGGTPLFVTELCRHLTQKMGPFHTGAQLPATLRDLSVPASIERAIAERLESMPADLRTVLETGALIGREFSFDVLRAATEVATDTLIESIEILTRLDVWERSGDEIEFVHGVMRDETLAAIAEKDRGRLHENVATAIESVHAADIKAYVPLLATHYEQIGEYSTAFEYYRKAGQYAAETSALEEAVHQFDNALELAREHEVASESALAAVLRERGSALLTLGEVDEAAAAFEDSLEIAAEINDREAIAASRNKIAKLATKRDEFTKAWSSAMKAREIATALDAGQLHTESLIYLGNIATKRGDLEQAKDLCQDGLALARTQEDPDAQARLLNRLGVVAFKQGAFDQARDYYERGLEISRELGDSNLEANCLINLGNIVARRGNYDQARRYYEQSLDIKAEIGDRESEGVILTNLGVIALYQGDYEQAAQYHERSLAISREIDDKTGIATCLNNLGDVAIKQGAYTEAREYLEESLEIIGKIDNSRREAQSLHNLGVIAEHKGQYEKATRYYEQSLEIKAEIGDRHGQAESLHRLGFVKLEQGQSDTADEQLTEALEVARDLGATVPEMACLRHLARLERQRGNPESAANFLEDSLATSDEGTDPQARAKTHLERARLALAQSNAAAAQEAVTAAEEILRDIDAPHEQARLERLQGRVMAATDSPEPAHDHWETALKAFRELGARQDELSTHQYLVRDARRRGETEEARENLQAAAATLEEAPAAVQRNHREWVKDMRGTLQE